MAGTSVWNKLTILTVVIVPFVAAIWAVTQLWNQMVGPVDLALLLTLYALGTLGIGIGYHRMLTHKGFEANGVVRYIFLSMGSLALEGPAISWAATHLKHHAKSDRGGDPHSPLEGFWHAHLGWLFSHGQTVEPLYYRGFEGDKAAKWASRTFWFWAAAGLVVPFLIAGWEGLVWGGLVRVFFNHHVTWSVNSVCHTFGRQDFDTPDRSKNEWIIGLLGFGEGWHNNHHAYPRSAVHGLRWYQFDLSGLLIRLLARLRILRNVWIVKKDEWAAKLVRGPPRRQPA